MTFKHSVYAGPGDKWGRAASLPLAFALLERGLGSAPSRLPGAGSCGAGGCAPGPGAALLTLSPFNSLQESPQGEPGFGALSTRSFLWHPAFQAICSYAWGQDRSPCKGSCSPLQSFLSFRGLVPRNPSTARTPSRCQAWVRTLPGVVR